MTVICTDAGHGGKDPGAMNGSATEKNIALQITKRLNAYLQRCGFKIVTTRTADTYPELQKRCDIANNANADLFISIHLNSAENKTASGIETFVYEIKGTTGEIGKKVQDTLIASTKAINRGLKTNPSLHVLNGTKMPALLVETGFISNDAELKKLQTADYQQTIAEAIGKAVALHFKKTPASTAQTVQKPSETKIGAFTDTAGHWADAAIKEITDKKIMNGKADGTFGPNEALTRAQAAVMIQNLLDYLDR